MKDKKPGIDLDYWLNNSTSQGLPTKNTPNGDLWYWHPRNGSIARFYANSDRANLNCNRNPENSKSYKDEISSLGITYFLGHFTMKTYNNLYNDLCSLDNLKLAFKKARKRKSNKFYVIKFRKNKKLKKNISIE